MTAVFGTREYALQVASGEIGYVESGGPDGHSGNITKYWAEVYPLFQGQPWCDCFVRWVYGKSGVPIVSRSFSVYQTVTDYKNAGRFGGMNSALPGDQVCYNIGMGHTGMVKSIDVIRRTVRAIEGNTSSGLSGSQDNGGGVYERVRSFDVCIGVGKPPFVALTSTGTLPIPPFTTTDFAEAFVSKIVSFKVAGGDGKGLDPDGHGDWVLNGVGGKPAVAWGTMVPGSVDINTNGHAEVPRYKGSQNYGGFVQLEFEGPPNAPGFDVRVGVV